MATGSSSQHTLTLTVPQLPGAGQTVPMGSGGPDPSANPTGTAGGVPSATGSGGGAGQPTGTGAAQPVAPNPSANPNGSAGGTPSATGGGQQGGGTGASGVQQPNPQGNPNGYPVSPAGMSQGGGSGSGGQPAGGGGASAPALPAALSRVDVPFFALSEDIEAYSRAKSAGANWLGAFRAMRDPFATRHSRTYAAMLQGDLIDDQGQAKQAFTMDDSLYGETTTVLPEQHPVYAARQRYAERVGMMRMGAMGLNSAVSGMAADYYSPTAFTDQAMAGNSLKTMGLGLMFTMNPYAIGVGAAMTIGGSVMGINAAASERGLSQGMSMARMERPSAIAMAARGEVDPTGSGVHNLAAGAAAMGAKYGYSYGESVYTMTQLDTATGLAGAGSDRATEQALALSAQGIGPGVSAYLRSQIGMNVARGRRADAAFDATSSAFSGAQALGLTGDRATEYMSRLASYAQGQNELGIGFDDRDVSSTARFSANLGKMGEGSLPAGYAISATTGLMATSRDAANMLNVGGGLAETAIMAAAAAEGGSLKDIRKRARQWSRDPYKTYDALKSQLGDNDAAYEALSSRIGDEAAELMQKGVSREEIDKVAPGGQVSKMSAMQAEAAAALGNFADTMKRINTEIETIERNLKERERGTKRTLESGFSGSADLPPPIVDKGDVTSWRGL